MVRGVLHVSASRNGEVRPDVIGGWENRDRLGRTLGPRDGPREAACGSGASTPSESNAGEEPFAGPFPDAGEATVSGDDGGAGALPTEDAGAHVDAEGEPDARPRGDSGDGADSGDSGETSTVTLSELAAAPPRRRGGRAVGSER